MRLTLQQWAEAPAQQAVVVTPEQVSLEGKDGGAHVVMEGKIMKDIKTLGKFATTLFILAGFLTVCVAQQSEQMPSQSTSPSVTHKMSKSEKEKTAAGKGALVDINSASKEDLSSLPGMNPDLAQKVIDGRPYTKKSDLEHKAIVPKDVYEAMQGQIIAKRGSEKK